MNLGTLHSKEKQTFRLVVVLRSRANAHDVVGRKYPSLLGLTRWVRVNILMEVAASRWILLCKLPARHCSNAHSLLSQKLLDIVGQQCSRAYTQTLRGPL